MGLVRRGGAGAWCNDRQTRHGAAASARKPLAASQGVLHYGFVTCEGARGFEDDNHADALALQDRAMAQGGVA